jgi:hypothetical protein
MHEITLVLIEVGALLLIMSLASRLANRLGQSPIPFYMTIGLLFGVGGFLSLEASMPFLKTGSEIGVVLLALDARTRILASRTRGHSQVFGERRCVGCPLERRPRGGLRAHHGVGASWGPSSWRGHMGVFLGRHIEGAHRPRSCG